MHQYYRNVYDYIERFDQEMVDDSPEDYRYGDDDLYIYSNHEDIGFTPRKVGYSLNCRIASIVKEQDKFRVTLVGTGNNDKAYQIEWIVKPGTLIEVNTYEAGVVCCVGPSMIPIVIKVIDVSEEYLKFIPWGIDAFYADKCAAGSFNTLIEEEQFTEWQEGLRESARELSELTKQIEASKENLEKAVKMIGKKFLGVIATISITSEKLEATDTALKEKRAKGIEYGKQMREKWGKRWDKEE